MGNQKSNLSFRGKILNEVLDLVNRRLKEIWNDLTKIWRSAIKYNFHKHLWKLMNINFHLFIEFTENCVMDIILKQKSICFRQFWPQFHLSLLKVAVQGELCYSQQFSYFFCFHIHYLRKKIKGIDKCVWKLYNIHKTRKIDAMCQHELWRKNIELWEQFCNLRWWWWNDLEQRNRTLRKGCLRWLTSIQNHPHRPWARGSKEICFSCQTVH